MVNRIYKDSLYETGDSLKIRTAQTIGLIAGIKPILNFTHVLPEKA